MQRLGGERAAGCNASQRPHISRTRVRSYTFMLAGVKHPSRGRTGPPGYRTAGSRKRQVLSSWGEIDTNPLRESRAGGPAGTPTHKDFMRAPSGVYIFDGRGCGPLWGRTEPLICRSKGKVGSRHTTRSGTTTGGLRVPPQYHTHHACARRHARHVGEDGPPPIRAGAGMSAAKPSASAEHGQWQRSCG